MIWTSNPSVLLLPAETFFVTHIWNSMFLLMCIIWGISTFYMHLCSLSPIYRARCAQRKGISSIFLKKASICHVYLWKPLQISSCLALFLVTRGRCKTRHMGRSKCNRSFHSQDVSQPQIGGSFWKKKKKLCTL